MTSAVFYFQVHQPYRLQPKGGFGSQPGGHFDDPLNQAIARRVADRCYLPMNRLLLEAIQDSKERFRCAFALSGTVLSQLEEWAPDALKSFQELADTGCVEIICETSHHSLASQVDAAEFEHQVREQRSRLESLFGQEPTTFRNTELILDSEVARRIEAWGFEALLGEGVDRLLQGRTPRRVYRPGGCEQLKLLLRDYEFSDDIAFRFSNREWESYPLMAETFASWLKRPGPEDQFVGMYMDYETFGEHQGPETGIFDFMKHLPGYFLEEQGMRFVTPREVAREHDPSEVLELWETISWADAERDLSAWLHNPMQRDAQQELYKLRPLALEAAALGQPGWLDTWRKLTTSDHVYYMCNKHQSDGDVHEYFTPYESPHESYLVFMRVLDDLRARLQACVASLKTKTSSERTS